MKKELFRLDIGVLLNKDDEEFECYNQVYTKEFGFYDEDQSIYLDYNDAIKEAKEYVKNGVDRTYAVISSDGIYDIGDLLEDIDDEDERQSILNETYATEISYNEGYIDYFIYKNGDEIKTVIDMRKELCKK